MNILSEKFIGFMCVLLKGLLVIDLIASVGIIFASFTSVNLSTIVFGVVLLLAIILGYKLIGRNMNSNNKLILILAIGFIVRVFWLLNANSIPNSDFKTMYVCAGDFLNGDKSAFYGTGYIGRFPHFTVTTLYMALMRYLFPLSNLLAMKIINLISSVGVLLLIYFIVNEVFSNKKYALEATLIGGIFPPFITYTGVFCGENMAMPFYLLSIYIFLLGIKHKRSVLFILSGMILAFGNLFRMIALVVLIAYLVYLLINYNEKILNKVKHMAFIVVPYLMVIFVVSSLLQNAKITQYPLWRGSEPKITSVLRGTNLNSFGTWNPEDAKLVEDNLGDYDKIEKLCKTVIFERLTTTPVLKLTQLYLVKFVLQWSVGDLCGSLWTLRDVDQSNVVLPINVVNIIGVPASAVFQFIYAVIILLVLIGMFNKNTIYKNKSISLFLLILCGYGATYLITEGQPRYSYIACWVLIILAVNGLDLIRNRNITLSFGKKIKIKNIENKLPSINE
ncbi:glycosyltransferase family 39 protein [Clostridium sp. C2-6-12]|uniref:glycosyltransferase family 39 protein n=1 Tax=Clostridium sp. C2-6-12 TaxID=2698832 RepID=UPI00136EDD1B|nr:glycosyltransferase family 39 protein [Clostridium sp. C2-6-12]